ncbi:uncharacterized protein G2W53_043837 [Senna tora]|uniref:Uncharacterized protein n=1 Tax=Senna tora TaxID=362788 RepID=A0A834W3R9_9FABA|nr:uncharacterized protein G2W53_043837 [Senna tora]
MGPMTFGFALGPNFQADQPKQINQLKAQL